MAFCDSARASAGEAAACRLEMLRATSANTWRQHMRDSSVTTCDICIHRGTNSVHTIHCPCTTLSLSSVSSPHPLLRLACHAHITHALTLCRHSHLHHMYHLESCDELFDMCERLVTHLVCFPCCRIDTPARAATEEEEMEDFG